jgi:hypothetical protein
MGSAQGPAGAGPIGDLLPGGAPQSDEHREQPEREQPRREQPERERSRREEPKRSRNAELIRHRKKPSSFPVVLLAAALVVVLAVVVFLLVRSMRSESSAPVSTPHPSATAQPAHATTTPPAFCTAFDNLVLAGDTSSAATRVVPSIGAAAASVVAAAPASLHTDALVLSNGIQAGSASVQAEATPAEQTALAHLTAYYGTACPHSPEVARALTSADASEAQSDLRNALTAAKTLSTERSTYIGVTPQTLARIEPSIQYVSGPATRAGVVSIGAVTTTRVIMAARATSGACYFVKDDASTGTVFATSPAGPCDASRPPATWQESW